MVQPRRAYVGHNERQTLALEGKQTFIKVYGRTNNFFIKTQLKGNFSYPFHLLSHVMYGWESAILLLSSQSLSTGVDAWPPTYGRQPRTYHQ